MFVTIQAHEYNKNTVILDRMFRLRKKVFADQLGWNVPIVGEYERDGYDSLGPVYLVWCNSAMTTLYGSMRLMPTTGPTLLYDVFRETFPSDVELVSPGIWEGTRMCVDEQAIAADHPDLSASQAFSRMFVALCEWGLHHGIHTMISNYEPQLRRVYRRTGADVDELGRSDGYGRHPVCCGAFDVSADVLARMRRTTGLERPLYTPDIDIAYAA